MSANFRLTFQAEVETVIYKSGNRLCLNMGNVASITLSRITNLPVI
jgi:hypothetical protein